MSISVYQSRLTGHWIVDQNGNKQGWRNHADAIADADEKAKPLRETAALIQAAIEREKEVTR